MTHKVCSICSLAVYKKILVNHTSSEWHIFKGLAFLSLSSKRKVPSKVSPQKRQHRPDAQTPRPLFPPRFAPEPPLRTQIGSHLLVLQRSHPPAGKPPANFCASHPHPREISHLMDLVLETQVTVTALH